MRRAILIPGTQNVVYEKLCQRYVDAGKIRLLSDRVRQGFNACVYGGICYGLTDVPVTISAKTGTAESFINVTNEDGTTTRYDTTNNSVVAYAPAENPDYAMACMIPNAWVTGGGSQSNLCLRITNELTKAIYNPDDGAQNSETPAQPDSNPGCARGKPRRCRRPRIPTIRSRRRSRCSKFYPLKNHRINRFFKKYSNLKKTMLYLFSIIRRNIHERRNYFQMF